MNLTQLEIEYHGNKGALAAVMALMLSMRKAQPDKPTISGMADVLLEAVNTHMEEYTRLRAQMVEHGLAES